MKDDEPFRVEVDHEGCMYCNRGKQWTVVGPDGVASSTSWEDEDDAEKHARDMNYAFAQGRMMRVPE